MVYKIGTVIEISTSRGFAYAQYTHNHKTHGALIRVMKGLYEKPQTDLEMLVHNTNLFSIFFPIVAAMRQKLVNRVGVQPVPAFAQKFPIFKQGFPDPKTGKVASWTLWDGEKTWRTQELTEEEKNYPLSRIASLDTLTTRIEEEWTPASDFKVRP